MASPAFPQTEHLDTEHLADTDSKIVKALITRLHLIFLSSDLYKDLLRCKEAEAQKLLDTFQWLLDKPELDVPFRRHLVVATQRLAKRSQLYPACYELQDIIQDNRLPVEAGGFADIYKGRFEGQTVCLKAIRVYQSTRIEYLLKVAVLGQLSPLKTINSRLSILIYSRYPKKAYSGGSWNTSMSSHSMDYSGLMVDFVSCRLGWKLAIFVSISQTILMPTALSWFSTSQMGYTIYTVTELSMAT
ncbi:hypothetical protein H2248_000273 [Termitomyces sp. 'cryptogamus']|nr:hypothetical protein H2248_000273 [Termitomyces sp. 'cryptogamus']